MARSLAMGGTQAAWAQGAEAIFSNPAGLACLEGRRGPAELSLAYGRLLESVYSGAASYARPLGAESAVGFGVLYFTQAPQTAYSTTGDSTGEFTPYDLAAALGYGRRSGRIRMGASLKLIRSSLADVSGATAAADVSVQVLHAARVGDTPVDIGAGLSNLGPGLRLGENTAPLPLHLRAGMLWHASEAAGAALDLNLPVDHDPYVSLGFEREFKRDSLRAALRLGYNQAYARDVEGLAGVTAGAGVDTGGFRLDYAWVPFGELGMTNRFSLLFRF